MDILKNAKKVVITLDLLEAAINLILSAIHHHNSPRDINNFISNIRNDIKDFEDKNHAT